MNRVALITGAAGGIGAATAKVFKERGWYTVGTDRISPKNMNFVDRFVRADIANPQEIQSVFEHLQNQEGRLDALINNAAVQLVKPLVQTEPDEWDKVMAVNVRAAYLTMKYAYPLLKENHGSIINVSSVHAVATSENMAAYVTSKGALVALTRAAALELAVDKIRVNAVLPGAIDTGMLRSGLSRNHLSGNSIKERLKSLGLKHAVKRIGKPAEIGEIILFLAESDKSAFITGQSLIIDGGATARLSTE